MTIDPLKAAMMRAASKAGRQGGFWIMMMLYGRIIRRVKKIFTRMPKPLKAGRKIADCVFQADDMTDFPEIVQNQQTCM